MAKFLDVIIPFIHACAAEARRRREDDYDGPLWLAAYLFAISSQLLTEQRGPQFYFDASESEELSWKAVLGQLEALDLGTDVAKIYWTLISVLQFIEGMFTLRQDKIALRSSTDLEKFSYENGTDSYKLSGLVYHWLRPKSELAALRSKRFKEADKRPPPPAPDPIQHLENLGMFWKSDCRLPSLSIDPYDKHSNSLLIRESGKKAAKDNFFKVALCPLVGDFHPLFEIEEKKEGFPLFTICRSNSGIHNPIGLKRHLTDLLEAAGKERVHLMVFPELCINKEARDHIREWLRTNPKSTIQGIIAGSFHIWEKSSSDLPFNEAIFFGHRGEKLLDHKKRGLFRIGRSQKTQETALQSFVNKPSRPGLEIAENIQHGNSFSILETTLGRFGLLICADVLEADPYGYEPLIKRIRPDLLFIISMSSETEKFAKFIEEMYNYEVGTLFVNANCICNPTNEPILAAVNLALFELNKAPPTTLRWRLTKSLNGEAKTTVEQYVYPEHRWKEVELSDSMGISWLGDKWGLVINLGIQWKNPNEFSGNTDNKPLAPLAPLAKRKHTDSNPISVVYKPLVGDSI